MFKKTLIRFITCTKSLFSHAWSNKHYFKIPPPDIWYLYINYFFSFSKSNNGYLIFFLLKTKDFTFYWKSNGYGISTSKKENVRKIFWDITFQRKKIDGWHGFSRIFCNRTLKCRTFVWCFFRPFTLFLKFKLSIFF